MYKIPHEQIELVRQRIFRDETNGDALQKYIPHFSGTKGEAQASTVAHVETLSVDDKLTYLITRSEKTVGEPRIGKPLKGYLKTH